MPQNMVQAASDQFWYSRGRPHIMRVNDMRGLAAMAFEAGAKWSMVETSKLSPHIAQFLEMCVLLGVLDNETMGSDPESATEEGRTSREQGSGL